MAEPGYPAAWYADPHDPTQWRWWDGSGWTDVTSPVVDGHPEPDASDFHARIAAFEPEATYAPPQHQGAPAMPWYVTMLAPNKNRVEDEWRSAETSCFFGLFGLLFAVTTLFNGHPEGRSVIAGAIALGVAISVGPYGMYAARRNDYPLGMWLSGIGMLTSGVGVVIIAVHTFHLLA